MKDKVITAALVIASGTGGYFLNGDVKKEYREVPAFKEVEIGMIYYAEYSNESSSTIEEISENEYKGIISGKTPKKNGFRLNGVWETPIVQKTPTVLSDGEFYRLNPSSTDIVIKDFPNPGKVEIISEF